MVSRMMNENKKNATCLFTGTVRRDDGDSVSFSLPNIKESDIKETIDYLHTKVMGENYKNKSTFVGVTGDTGFDEKEGWAKSPEEAAKIAKKYISNINRVIEAKDGKIFAIKLPDGRVIYKKSVVVRGREGALKGKQDIQSEKPAQPVEIKNQSNKQEADMSGNITKTELEALLRANKSEVDVVAANIQKEMAEWREQQNAQMTEVNKTLSILNVKMDERFENQKQSSTRIQWMVGVAIAAAALVPAYFGMVKSEPAPMQQPTIVYVQQPAPAVQAASPQVQPAPQEPTSEPQKAPATKQ